ncbi:hypothetical protein [Teichococcus aestuarii]|uniref:hypothetical protein n=1 Tax=Teichococcus aestuarii TaxID=568898 RepID=UPI003617D6EE
MSATALPALLAALDSLETTLKLAEALATGGRSIDLEGLDAEVTALCAAALSLPAAEQAEAGWALRRLHGRVERLQRLV